MGAIQGLTRTLWAWRRRAGGCAVLSLSVLIVACGGMGYGTSSTSGNGSAAPAGNTPPAGAGSSNPTTTSGTMAAGTITSFGSVILNGIEYQTTNATVEVDGRIASQSDLHAGDFIQVKGHHDESSNEDVADQIDFRGNVAGPVSSIDMAANTLVVLGQTVVVSPETSFDDAISPSGLAGIHVGDVIEVSGMDAVDGTIHATRIDARAANAGLQIIGTASGTDTTAKTLEINALVVDFSTATLVDFPASGPKNGDVVEAIGTTLDPSGALKATSLELRTGASMQTAPNDNLRIEGLVTKFTSASNFEVGGLPVMTAASTVFFGGAAADLALNVSVEIEGTVNSSGVLVATSVRIRLPADVRLMAQVDALDANAGTLRILGVTISVNELTRFEDHGDQRVYTFKLSDIHTGDWLEVRGRASSGSNSVIATRIDRRQQQSLVQVLGPVSSASQPNFSILSINITTTSSTQFHGGLSVDRFFNSPVANIVRVKGRWDGTMLTATDVNPGNDDDGGDNEGHGGAGDDSGDTGGDGGGGGDGEGGSHGPG